MICLAEEVQEQVHHPLTKLTQLNIEQADRAIIPEIDGEGAHFVQLQESQRLKQLEGLVIGLTSALDAMLEAYSTLNSGYVVSQAI